MSSSDESDDSESSGEKLKSASKPSTGSKPQSNLDLLLDLDDGKSIDL